MQFRQQALAKLRSPEEIDLPVRFARPQGCLVLAVTVVVMAAATVWAVTGSLSSTVGAAGILTHGQGSYVLQSPVAGQVTEVLVEEGRHVPANTPLLKVRTAGGTTVVRTIAAGRVTTLVATIGSVVTTGTDVAAVERIDSPDDPLMAMLYLPADNGSEISVGASVDLTVQSVPAKRYGVLRGEVKSVGRTGLTAQRIAGALGSNQLGEHFSKGGQPVPVLVQLDRSSSTTSGFTWSTSDGPPYAVDSMTLADGTIHLAEQRPIDWLLP
ncbi:HlyD family efflux transporter periplasmic adaptor subunit [Streptomyces sp. NPDC102274]|uniref:HlyD family efflux transporter periplasmic adaptor subunit n=1 Tax=Streptomyces sp. NPDC102274 TaxID=3366151 RepID=UPI0037F5F3BC